MENLSRFNDKIVVINGASRGIGAGLAKRFTAEGAKVVLTANEERIHDVAQEIRDKGQAAQSMIVDVTLKHEVEIYMTWSLSNMAELMLPSKMLESSR